MQQIMVFDAYGTLFDVHSAVARHAKLVGERAGEVSQIWRQKQLEYTWTRSLMHKYRDFWELTQISLDFALAAVPGANPLAREELLDAYRTLDAYSEVKPVLSTMKALGQKLAILSNGTPQMLSQAVASAGLEGLFDAVLSVNDLKTYKTGPKTYAMVCSRFGCNAGDVAFHSSNRWDIAGAAAFGFQTIWINRTSQPDEYADLPPGRVVASLLPLSVG